MCTFRMACGFAIVVCSFPGNQAIVAQELSADGVPVPGRLTPTTTQHVFFFEIAARGRYRIATSGYTQISLELFAANSFEPLDPSKYKGNKASPDLVNQIIECDLTAGSYLVRVRHAAPRGVGEFEVSLKRLGSVADRDEPFEPQTKVGSTATARLWLQTGHGAGQIRRVKYAGSDLILTTGDDATFLWQMSSQRELRRFEPAYTSDVTEDGYWVLTGNDEETRLSDGRTGNKIWNEVEQDTIATHVAFLSSDSMGELHFLVVKALRERNAPGAKSRIEVRSVKEPSTVAVSAEVPLVTTLVDPEALSSTVVFGCKDGAIRRFQWSMSQPQPEEVVRIGDKSIVALAESTGEGHFFCVTEAYELFLIRPSQDPVCVADLKKVKRPGKNLPLDYRFVFFKDGQRLLTSDSDGRIRIWKTDDGSMEIYRELGRKSVSAIDVCEDRELLVGRSNGTASIMRFDMRAESKMGAIEPGLKERGGRLADDSQVLRGRSTVVESVQFSGDGTQLFTDLNDGTSRVWDLRRGDQQTLSQPVNSARVRNGSYVEVKDDEGQPSCILRLFPPPERPQEQVGIRSITAFAFSPATNRLAIISEKEVGVFDTATCRELGRKTLADTLTAVALSNDGTWVAVGEQDSFSVLQINANMTRVARQEVAGDVTAICVSPIGTSRIAVAASRGELTVWTGAGSNLKYRKSLSKSSTGAAEAVRVLDAVFTPDGQMLFCGCSDGVARLLDIRDRAFERTFATEFETDDAGKEHEIPGHRGPIQCVAVSTVAASNDSTNKRLIGVTGGQQDKRAIVWDLEREENDPRKQLCQLMSFRLGEWFVLDDFNRFDADSLENIKGVHWIFSDAPFSPGSPSLFQHQYYEPGLLARKVNQERFDDVPYLTYLNRAQPNVEILDVRRSGSNSHTVDVRVKVTKGSLQLEPPHEPMTSNPHDLRLFRDGQLVAQYPHPDDDYAFMPALDLAGSGDLKESPDLPRWRQATDVFDYLNDDADGEIQGNTAYVWFREIALPSGNDDGQGKEQVTFTAYAFNDERVRTDIAQSRPHEYKPKLDPKPKAYVLAVGVNAYETRSWDLQFAANDAVQFERVMRNQLDLPFEVLSVPLISEYRTISETLNPSSRRLKRVDATAANIQLALQALAGRVDDDLSMLPGDGRRLTKATPDDVLILFFAGHGFTANEGTFYFFPYDIGLNQRNLTPEARENGISSTELSRWLRDVDVGRAVMIVDACQSASVVAPPGMKIGPFGSRGLGQLAYDKGMQVLAASQSDQVALELSDLGDTGHGLLTYSLLERLGNQFEPITLTELLKHTQANVRILHEKLREDAIKQKTTSEVIIDGRSTGGRLTTEERKALARFPVQEPVLFNFGRSKLSIRLGKRSE